MPSIYVLIVTFKRKEMLEKVIQSVMMQSKSVSKIIIVDNNSNDGTDELIGEIKRNNSHTQIDYHNTGANLGGAGGFSFGFNVAIKENFDYLWIMDDDLCPQNNCLEKLLETASNDTIVQPIRYNLDGSCAEYSPVVFDLESVFIARPKRKTVNDCLKYSPSTEIPLHGIPFEGPLIPRNIINKIGVPDGRFFIFYDDLDYAIRARKAGFSIKCNTDAIATRLLINNQVTDLQSWKGYFMLRNFFRIHYRHGGNFLVKLRPLILATGFIAKELLCLRKKSVVICFHALVDSLRRDFKVRHKYVP